MAPPLQTAILLLTFIIGGASATSSTRGNGTYPQNSWDAARSKADEMIAQMNATEKIALVTGSLGGVMGCIGNINPIERLNFSGICFQDGPNAMNRADLVSVFPSGVTVAASWDKEVFYSRGRALGEEFRGKGANVLLGPTVGPLGRNPLGGRNWEGFSPDPYLSGIAIQESIRGIQSVNVQACAKHFIGNEQETQRSNTFLANGTEIAAISSNIDDRTLHELYAWPFANAVRANVSSVMCSYNRLNQTYACENDQLLNGMLREELGFQGYVMSDWFALHSGAKSINAGLDLDMPGTIDSASLSTGASYFGQNITAYLDEGSITEDTLDTMIRRILTQYYLLQQDTDYPSLDPTLGLLIRVSVGQRVNMTGAVAPDVRGNHKTLIRQMAAESTVLLKNTDALLPLRSPRSIAVFGNDANDRIGGLYHNPYEAYEFGVVDIGGGAGSARHVYISAPLNAIRERAVKDDIRLRYVTDNVLTAAGDFSAIFPMPEVCMVFLGTWAAETLDRTEFEADWNSTLVVEQVSSFCPKTVVVTHSAGINLMPWATNPNVTAILAAHLPGEEAGDSIVDVLWGDVDPSGRLPYTIAQRASDYGSTVEIVNLTESEITSPTAWQSDFEEGLMIDYRHFDAAGTEPLYAFGYGLSYTNFSLAASLQLEQQSSNSTLAARPQAQSPSSPGGNAELWDCVLRISAEVMNTGTRAGAAVPQLYVSYPNDTTPAGTPPQVLRGFEKVWLQPGEERSVDFELARRDVSYWDTELQDWVVPSGDFTFHVGFSSREILTSSVSSLR